MLVQKVRAAAFVVAISEYNKALIIQHCGEEPACIMTGGAGWKMAPSMTRPFELVDNLIFDGLLEIASRRFAN